MAEIVQLADRRRGDRQLDDFNAMVEARKELHDAFRFEMRAAFERVKGPREGVMDHLTFEEFELWVADRIMKRKRMLDVRQRLQQRQRKVVSDIRSGARKAVPLKDALRLLRSSEE